MKPEIQGTRFGSITVHGETYDHNIVIPLNISAKSEFTPTTWIRPRRFMEKELQWPKGGTSLPFRDPAGNSVELVTRGLWGLPSGW